MTRNIITRVLAVLTMSLLVLAGGCGGGGSSSPSKLIYGTVSKGILYPGSVSLYGVDSSGVRASSPMTTVVTDSSGRFTADIGAYSGALLIEATGTYTDEATGSTVTIGAARPMKAAVSGVNSATTRRFAVTPLTDLAVSLAGTLTPANIDAANLRVSSLFKISDITAVEPVQPAAAAMATATTDQQSYTLALAALSQMAKTANPSSAAAFAQIVTILASYKSDLDVSATAGLGTINKNAFSSALGIVTSGSLSGFSAAAANLGAVGTRTLTLTLATSGVPAGTLIGGVQGTITLPAGTSLRLDPVVSGSVLASLFVLSGNAGQSLLSNTVNGSVVTFGLINANGFAGGDIATLVVDVSSGAPTAADFALSGITVLDNSNNPAVISGATVTVR